MAAMIEVSDLRKVYGDTVVLDGIDLSVDTGETVALVGPSGCGKTTFLHILAGLREPTHGSYSLGGSSSIVFQDPRLLPWRTARANIRVADDISDRAVGVERSDELLRLVGLDGYGDAYPGQLSGGMQQRVAFARALAVDPDILLLDEPFGSLDYMTKKHIQQRFGDILDEGGITSLYVTHNLDDALAVGDRILVLSQKPCTILERWETGTLTDRSEIEDVLEQSYTEPGAGG